MIKNFLWTKLRARLTFIKSKAGQPYNWLFLPGGPGLGSESLANLTSCLELPGTMWFLDFPGDGSNLIDNVDNNEYYFARWTDALVEAVSALGNVIIVAHSTGGMYVLASPNLKKLLKGLVLMDTAPDASWQDGYLKYCKANPLQEMDALQKIYVNNKTVENLKKLTLASLPSIFTPAGLSAGRLLFEKLPYNVESCEWSDKHFDKTYQTLWVPDNIPTLIFAGDQDNIVPLTYFEKSQDFQKTNIVMRRIQDAGHFPWIEKPKQVRSLFEEFLTQLVCV
jgi:pimeloyl-ACP methyl ester carboxylesterase